jgi:hypothetical protein
MTSSKNLVTYVVENKDWIFSGIGVLAITWLLTALKKSRPSAKQTINSGAKSKNVQALGNINISTKRKR